jgi:hypothetical protein
LVNTLLGKGFANLLSGGNGVLGKISIIGLSDFQGPLEGLLYLVAKPMFHTVGNKSYCHKKKKDGWNEGKADKGDHQFCPELGSQDLPLSLKDQFHHIPDDQEDEEENQDDVDVDETEDNNIIGDGDFSPNLGEFYLNGGQDEDEDGDDPDNEELISSSSSLRGKCFRHLLTFLIPPTPSLAKGGSGGF